MTAIIFSVLLFGTSAKADWLASPPLIVNFTHEWLCCVITNLSEYDFDVTIQVVGGYQGEVKESETITLEGRQARKLCSDQVGGGLASLAGYCKFYVPVKSSTVKATATVCRSASTGDGLVECTHALEASSVPSFVKIGPKPKPWERGHVEDSEIDY